MGLSIRRIFFFIVVLAACANHSEAATYVVGPGQPYTTPSAVARESLAPGDLVLIHWQSTPYRDK
jgi:hypothetical protein